MDLSNLSDLLPDSPDEMIRVGIVVVLAIATGLAAGYLRRLLRRRELQAAARAHTEAVKLAHADGKAPPPAADEPPPRGLLTRLLPPSLMVVVMLAAIEATGLLSISALLGMLKAGLEFEILRTEGVSLTPMTFVTLGIVLVISTWASRGAQAAIGRSLRTRESTDEGVIAALQRLAHYAVMAIGIMLGLQAAGVNLSALVAASAVFAVGIGFGLQNVAQNFISGLMLLIERTIKPGDILRVDGTIVRIEEMGIRATIARTMDDEDVIIPNSKLVENIITNHSMHTNVVRARAVVGVAYHSDLEEVTRVLTKAATAFSGRVRNRAPVVLLQGFGASSIDFEVSVWVRSAFSRPADLSGLRMAMWRALKDAEIEIAFPQVDVHLDAEVVEALRRQSAPAPDPSSPST